MTVINEKQRATIFLYPFNIANIFWLNYYGSRNDEYCFSWHLTYITRAFVHVSESCAYIVFRDESRIMTRGVTFVGIVRRDGQEFEILLQIYLTVHRESPSCRHTNLSRLNYKNYWTLKMCWFSIRIMRNNKI